MESSGVAVGCSFAASASGFDAFFRTHHVKMVRALGLTLGDVDFGRDAAAEGFARAFQRWSTVSAYANPSGWVYRVGLNWARSRRRRRRRERLGLTVDTAAPTVPTRSDDLIRAMRELSIEHRTVIVGRFYLDWSEAQLAASLDIAPGTVKSRLSRALAHLGTLVDNPLDAEGHSDDHA